jgi:hypothetical protein
MRATCLIHCILLELITLICLFGEGSKLCSASSCNCFQPHVPSSIFSTVSSDTICSPHGVKNKVSHSYTRTNTTDLCSFI